MPPIAAQPGELAFLLAALSAGIGVLLVLSRGTGPARFAVAGAMGLVLGLCLARASHPEPDRRSPVSLTRASEYVTSRACKSCHPGEYASWHKTYHRTMTQAAGAATVRAPLEHPEAFVLDGERYGMSRTGDAVWARIPEPGVDRDRRVVMTTGSHHYQAYWVEGERSGELRMFPFVYLLGASPGWLPRRDAFVQPPDARDASVRWASNCIQCHATAGRPAREASPETAEVAELGIACEACHGPGAAHVDRYRDPLARYAAHTEDRADTTLVNPSRLSPERASMICGTCHAYTFPRDEDDFWAHGYTRSYRPGQDLERSRILLTKAALAQAGTPTLDTETQNLFYDDGTVRIGGREYAGMVLSACYLRGEGRRKISCLSCHSMHDSEPDDQLTHGHEGDAACGSCHAPETYARASHTHHARGSEGSSCIACHMPKTSYALLKSIRSHRIDSPEAGALGASNRPNACGLCHLDRSLAWTAARLVEWYGQHETPREIDAATPAGAAWLLAGDPGQRAIAAAAMAEAGARLAAGDDWEAPLLASAENDPYAAVRFIAARSLRKLRRGNGHGRPPDPDLVDALVAARSTRALTLSE
jgi:hypothetical protein